MAHRASHGIFRSRAVDQPSLKHSGQEALAAHGADQIHDGRRTFVVMNFDLVLVRAVGLLDATPGFECGGDFRDGLGGAEAFDAQ